jgi:hypothetical protein
MVGLNVLLLTLPLCMEALLITTRWVFGRSVIRWATSRTAGTSATWGRGSSGFVRAAVTVHVRIVVAARRWTGPGIVRIVRVACARWTILIRSSHATTWWGSSITSFTPVIELARWSATAVVIAAGTVATRGAATIIVVIVGSGWVTAAAAATAAATAAHWGARAVPITATIIWSTRASIGSPRLEWRRWGWVGNVLGAGDFLTLELTAVQLLHCGL